MPFRIAVLAGCLALLAVPVYAERLSFGVEGTLLHHSGDGFVSVVQPFDTLAPLASSSADGDTLEPDDGWGGRIWVDVPLPIAIAERALTLRGTLNGAWFEGEDGGAVDLGGGSALGFDRESELDALWATIEIYQSWLFGPHRPRPHTMVGLGLGLEVADIENEFQQSVDMVTGGSSFPFSRGEQDTTFWGIGPRVSGYLDHELGASGVHAFAEAALAYLFGDRDIESQGNLSGSPVRDQDSEGGGILHGSLRFGLGYVMSLGAVDARLDVGWRHDSFQDVTSTRFLPASSEGDSNFGGPFVGIGFAVPLN